VANETTIKTVASGTHLNSIGTVKTVVGMVKAIDANGSERVLQAGDKVYPNETIQTAADGAVIVEFQDGSHLDLPHSAHIVLDSEIYTPKDSVAEQAEDEASRIEKAIAEGRDPSVVTDAAAAGGTNGDEGSSTPLVVGFDNTQGNVNSGFETAGLNSTPSSTQQDQLQALPEAAPQIVAAATVTEGTLTEQANTTNSEATDAVSGIINFSDINPADVHTVSVKAEGENYVGTFTPVVAADSTQTTTGTGTVAWSFKVADGALDFLAEGQTLTQKYDVTINDGNGGTVTQVVTITITGTNDGPAFAAADEFTWGVNANFAFEQLNTTNSETIDSSSGKLTFADVDLTDKHTVGATAQGEDYLGSFKPEITTDSTGTGAGVVSWTFDVPDSALDFLAAGQTLTQKYDVTIDDGHGGTSTQVVTIVITGTNDGPALVWWGADDSVSEQLNTTNSETIDSSSGQLIFADVDLTDKHTVGATAQGEDYLGSFKPEITTDSTGTGTGIVSWTFDVPDSALDFLAAGQVLTQKYDVTIDDGNGGTLTQVVTIVITGTNDAPVITNETTDTIGAVTEDDKATVSGQLSATDVDNGATQAWSIQGSADGTYGTLSVDAKTGAWMYTLNNDAKNVQALAAGESHDETFTVRVMDDQGAFVDQTITVTVNGADDASVLTADVKAVDEDSKATGNVLSNDSDIDSTLSIADFTINGIVYEAGQSVEIGGKGTFTLAADGSYTFTPASNWSGSVPEVTYTTTTGSSSALNIAVTPVADAPSLTISTQVLASASYEALAFNGDNAVIGSGKIGPSNADVTVTTYGLGIDGSKHGKGDDSGIDQNESLLINLKSAASNATFTINTATTEAFTGAWIAYDANFNQVGSGTISHTGTLTISSSTSFQYVVFDAHPSGSSASDPGFYVQPVSVTSATNLIVNGSFEDVGGVTKAGATVSDSNISNGGYVQMQSITGWSMDANSPVNYMEPHQKAHANVGVPTNGGDNYMDLGASPGNSWIAQSINGITAGGTYSLSFSYFDKAALQEAGQSGLDSGKLQVLWNGQVVATLDGNNTSTWNSFQIDVTGKSGTNTLAFHEVGDSGDNWGMAIDMVQLYSVTNFAHQYSLTLTAGLTDIDGSENLGHVLIDASTVPSGVVLMDGSTALSTTTISGKSYYEVDLGDTGGSKTLTLESSSELTGSQLSAISGSVTSTESLNGNAATTLLGGTSDDILNGGSGNDLLLGGAGNDVLSGGHGQDTFTWKSGETGSDIVKDFNAGTGGDVLNLADLLHNETSATLDNYLTFSKTDSGDTLVSIHADGGSAVTQTITLQGVDLTVGGTQTSTQIIQNLLDHGNLKTDA